MNIFSWFYKKTFVSFEDFKKDPDKYKADKDFLSSVKERDNSGEFIKELSKVNLNDAEKIKVYKHYYKLLSRNNFKNMFLNDNKNKKFLLFFIRNNYIKEDELYNLIHNKNKGFKDENNKSLLRMIAEKNFYVYPVLNLIESNKLYNKILGVKEISYKTCLSVLSSEILKDKEIRNKFLKSSNKDKYNILLLDYLLNDNLSLDDTFKELNNIDQVSIEKILSWCDDFKYEKIINIKQADFSNKMLGFLNYIDRNKDSQLKNHINDQVISLYESFTISLTLLCSIMNNYENKKCESLLYNFPKTFLIYKIKECSSSTDRFKTLESYLNLLKNKVSYNEIATEIFENIQLSISMFLSQKIILSSPLNKIFDDFISDNKLANIFMYSIIRNNNNFYYKPESSFYEKGFKNKCNFIKSDSALLEALIYERITKEDFKMLLSKQIENYDFRSFLSNIEKEYPDNIKEMVLSAYGEIEKDKIKDSLLLNTSIIKEKNNTTIKKKRL